MMKHRVFVVLAVLSLAVPPLSAATIRVPEDQPDIKSAISFADHGDVILVGPGTWFGVGNRGIELFGKRITLRSTDGPLATFISGSAVDRVFHIHHGEGRDTVIEGFTITIGLPVGTTTYGGAILIEESDGGAGSSPTFRDCTIRISEATYGGGVAVRGYDSHPLFDDCLFHTNNAVTGGAMHIQYRAEVWNSRFLSNTANNGGAVYAGPANVSWPTEFLNCRFISNIAEKGGALFAISNTDAIFRNCLFHDNYAEDGPGTGDGNGGAIYGGETTEFHFCTFRGNSAFLLGDTLYATSNEDDQEFHNSILWDSSTNSVVATQTVDFYNTNIRESALVVPANGNFSEDPQFVVGPGEDGNHYLSPISFCVDAGNTQADAVCDIGAGTHICLNHATTRTDLIPDSGVADIGFHYFDPAWVLLFSDGFEGGDTSMWTSELP